MRKFLNKLMLFALVILLVAGTATNLLAQKKFEGYWEQESIHPSSPFGKKSNTVEKEKTYYKAGKLKVVNLTTGAIMIYRFDKELMWNIDTKKKTYTEITFAQMEAMKKGMSSAMQEKMNDMSAEQKKMMEKMMGKKLKSFLGGEEGGLEIRAKKTGKTKTLLGHKCDHVILSMGDDPIMEMWITNKYRMGNEYLDLYKKMGMMKGEFSDDVKKIQGIPLATKSTIDMGMGKMETSTKVTKIVPKSISNSEFNLPKGLKKVESRMPMK